MKLQPITSVAFVLLSLVYAGCSGAPGEPADSTDEAISDPQAAATPATHSAEPATAAAGRPATAERPSAAARTDPAASSAATRCGEDRKECQVSNPNGTCSEVCVPLTALCVHAECIVCDPVGERHAGCEWSSTECKYVCDGATPVDHHKVVCDPVGKAPHEGCSWSIKECKWECPVCDPPPPPEKQGCQFDETACVWLCL